MRSLGGIVLLAGIGVALFVYVPTPVDRGSSHDKLQRVAASRDLQSSPTNFTPVARLGAFSPSIAPTMAARRGAGNYARSETTQNPSPTAAPAPASPTPAAETQPGWQTVFSAAPATTPAILPKTLSPADPDARYKLVLDMIGLLRLRRNRQAYAAARSRQRLPSGASATGLLAMRLDERELDVVGIINPAAAEARRLLLGPHGRLLGA